MIFMLHFDHQEQMRNVINMMLTSEQEMNIIILQKNLIKTKDIQEKLNKLQVLYELNECKNNELILWRKMKKLMNMTEKLMRQHVNASMINWWMKNQLKRLKKKMCKLKKSLRKKRNESTVKRREWARS